MSGSFGFEPLRFRCSTAYLSMQASDVNPTLAARSVEGLARFFRSAQCVDTFLFSVIAPTPALKAKKSE